MKNLNPIILNYNRKIGAICSSLPAVLYIGISIPSNQLNISILGWAAIQFLPLVLAGYYLDIIAKSKLFKPIWDRGWIIIIVSWMMLFPIARLIGILSSDYLFIGTISYTISQIGIYIVLSILLGAIYGFFFTSAYLYLLKIYLWRKNK